jgi:isopentenyldiphosphate isomerase
MTRLEVRLVNESGRTIGFGDRWLTHRVQKGPDGPILGRRHVGITIACVSKEGRILIAHRKHKIFDSVWTLSGDTHPYRAYGESEVETLVQAAKRCAIDDLGARVTGWTSALTVNYSARDPRDPRYCENELLHVMVSRYSGPFRMNPNNAYELRWAGLAKIAQDSADDLKKEPIDRKYAPWVHAIFYLPSDQVEEALSAG